MPWLRPEFPSSAKPEARVARSQLKPEAAAQNRPRSPKSRLQTGKTNKSLDIPDTAPRAIAVRGGRRARPCRRAARAGGAAPERPTRRVALWCPACETGVGRLSVSVEGLSGAVKLPILAGHIYIYSSCRKNILKHGGKKPECGPRTELGRDAGESDRLLVVYWTALAPQTSVFLEALAQPSSLPRAPATTPRVHKKRAAPVLARLGGHLALGLRLDECLEVLNRALL